MAELEVTATGAAALSGGHGAPGGAMRDVVQLRLPAVGAYLSVLRTATASLASRLDFTIDDIEDLRIAVDEACAMLLPQAVAGADLECRFELTDDAIDVRVGVLTVDGEQVHVALFVGNVGLSHRNRDNVERRHQNPGQQRPIPPP